jgi:hypothetical protein
VHTRTGIMMLSVGIYSKALQCLAQGSMPALQHGCGSTSPLTWWTSTSMCCQGEVRGAMCCLQGEGGDGNAAGVQCEVWNAT